MLSILALGVQACYRGPRLYDTPQVRDRVKKHVAWFKQHWDILEIDGTLVLETTRRLILAGFPVGPSSGLNHAAAVEVTSLLPNSGLIVTVFPDRMERYFSTDLFL